MRALFVLAGACFAVSACDGQSAADNVSNTASEEAVEAIVANDTTAIDAATGDSANMAADVAYTEGDANLDSTDGGETSARRRSTPRTTSDPELSPTDTAAEPAADPVAETNEI